MKNIYSDEGVRTRLMLAALDELCDHGVGDFSLRRVAIASQVSCAAPYRHFKSKEELIVETAKYITSKWTLLAEQIISSHTADLARTLTELCVAAAGFWIANGNFRSLLMPDAKSPLAEEMKAFDAPILDCADSYFNSRGCSADEILQKKNVLLALIYGTVVLVSSGKLTPKEAPQSVRAEILTIL